jgi:tRNA pseudouridine13 synthase
LALETEAMAPWQAWCEALEHVGLKQERRALRLQPLLAEWAELPPGDDDTGPSLRLSFELPPGTYATALLREVATLNNLSVRANAPEPAE